jgi:hypothetical protein
MGLAPVGHVAWLLCVGALGTACWRARTLEPEPTGTEVSDACADASCGAPASSEDPFVPPASCADRKPSNNPGASLCKAGTLELNCENAPPKIPCPRTFSEAARLACEQGAGQYLAYCNACGGTTVRLADSIFEFAVHFDAADQLVGVTLVEDDPVGPCRQHEFVFGTHCSAVEPATAALSVSCEGARSLGRQIAP